MYSYSTKHQVHNIYQCSSHSIKLMQKYHCIFVTHSWPKLSRHIFQQVNVECADIFHFHKSSCLALFLYSKIYLCELQANLFPQIAEVREKLTHRHEKIVELERHMLEMTNSVRQETEVLEKERQDLLAKIAKVFVNMIHEKLTPAK